MNEVKDLLGKWSNLQEKLAQLDESDSEVVGWKTFGLLLAAPPAVISCGELTQLSLRAEPNRASIMRHLEENFGIIDQDTMREEIGSRLHRGCQWQYEQFMSFWRGQPEFDLTRMNAQGQVDFTKDLTFAKQFYETLGGKGFAAWDIGESIHIVRAGYDCDFVDENFANRLINDLTDSALARYDNWQDYALSYICGGSYFAYAQTGRDEQAAARMFQQLLTAVEQLFLDPELDRWRRCQWMKNS